MREMNFNQSLSRNLLKDLRIGRFDEKTAKVEKLELANTPKFNIDSIIEKLAQGDKSALEELEKAGISYTYTERDNSYTVKFSYAASNYVVCCANANNGGSSIPTEGVTDENTTSVTPSNPENPTPDVDSTADSEPKGNIPDYSEGFDYSGIKDIDKPFETEDKINLNNMGEHILDEYKSALGLSSLAKRHSKLLDSMSQMKEQLHSYIKAQLEAKGLVYDKAFVEKVLNKLITDIVSIVDCQISNGTRSMRIDFSVPTVVFKDGTLVKPQDSKLLTPRDCVNLLVGFVKQSFSSDHQNSIYKFKFDIDNPQEREEDGLSKWEQIAYNDGSLFDPNSLINFNCLSRRYDNCLMDTDDYFLTEDEKKLKRIFRMLNGAVNSATSDKNEVKDYLRVYSEHLQKVYKQQYGDKLSDNSISYIIDSSMNKTLNSLKPDNDGLYSIEDVLNSLLSTADKMIENAIK